MILRAAFLYGAASHELRAARGHAAEALKLDASCARAHVAMAILAIIADLTPDAAFPHLEAASAIHPDMLEVAIVRVIALTAAHQYSDARNAAIEALAMHPASSAIAAYAAFSAYHAGDLAYARATLQRLLVFKPSAAFAIFLLGRTHLAEGNYSAARETLMSIIAGRVSTMAGCEKFRQGAIALLSYIEARTGQLEEARALVRDVQRSRHCSYVSLAVGAAGAREETSVCALLNEARTRCDPWFPFVESDPIFREYRDMPEFHRALFGESPSFKIS
jgi:tetratricopeptide (TPR) repeat protein